MAEGPFLKILPFIPAYLDQDCGTAESSLKCPLTDARLTAVRASMDLRRCASNWLHAAEFTSYRIDRVPLYELVRCGLDVPAPLGTPYTGMPATGP